jgi:hypothetical protein
MIEFTKARFTEAEDSERGRLCAASGAELGAAILPEPQFHSSVRALVEVLRQAGHDLWSFDESDEREVWCPSYANPTGSGIVITFTPGGVLVEWSEA